MNSPSDGDSPTTNQKSSNPESITLHSLARLDRATASYGKRDCFSLITTRTVVTAYTFGGGEAMRVSLVVPSRAGDATPVACSVCLAGHLPKRQAGSYLSQETLAGVTSALPCDIEGRCPAYYERRTKQHARDQRSLAE